MSLYINVEVISVENPFARYNDFFIFLRAFSIQSKKKHLDESQEAIYQLLNLKTTCLNKVIF